MDANTIISIIALITSVVATVVTMFYTRRFGYLDHTPVLVIRYDGTAERWMISNVGLGPAINITVAQQDDRDDQWYNPVLIPAIAAGENFTLEWLQDEGDFSLGARYSGNVDAKREIRFFTRTRDDQCAVFPAKRAPTWSMPEFGARDGLRRHWEHDLPVARST